MTISPGYEEAFGNLLDTWTGLEPAAVNAKLRELWPELIGPLKREQGAEIVPMFRHAGFVSDCAPPYSPVAVFRGELEGTGAHGVSWSSDRKVAMHYAGAWSPAGDALVLMARAPVAAILARFEKDYEVVVDPSELLEVRPVLRMPHWQYALQPPEPEPL